MSESISNPDASISSPRRRGLLIGLGLLAIGLIGLSGCGEAESDAPREETIEFAATVGDAPFACGQTYDELGTTNTTFEPFDFRLYISDVELQDGNGQWQPLQLDGDTPWHYEQVALLDFADGTGKCRNVPEQTRTIITGQHDRQTAIQGLRFQIGVPFEHNHLDVSTAASPLNQTAMFWNWLGGYKFIRLEGATTGLESGWQLHLGSTKCHPGEGQGPESCDNGNRIAVHLPDFDPARHKVVFDLASLVANSDLDSHTEQTPAGCMAGIDDPDCTPLFEAMGLPHGDFEGGDQGFVYHGDR